MPKQKDEAYVKRMTDLFVGRLDCRGHGESMTIRELAREVCKREGLVPLGRESADQLFSRALTTSDFPAVMASVATKFLRDGFSSAPRTYERWTTLESVSNYKPTSIISVGFPGELPIIRESGEYTNLDAVDGEETAVLEKRGGIFAISDTALLNDEIGVFRRIPKAMGITAARTNSRTAYRALLGSTALSDGQSVFHSDRGNLMDDPLGFASLGKALADLRLQKDSSGNPLSIEPRFLIVPPSLEMTAWALCYASSLPGQDNSGVGNIFKEKYGLEPIVAAELEDSSLGGSSKNWFISCDPEVFPTPFLRLSFLGSEGPVVKDRVDWKTDRVEFKVRTDFSVAQAGWRGMIKSTGLGE